MTRLLEYQAKRLFAGAGIEIPEGATAASAAEARWLASELGGPVMVKAQVRAGGRSKAGGVARAEDAEAAGRETEMLLGQRINGLTVRQVLIERALPLERELYLGLALDYDVGRIVALVGRQGGVEVERGVEQPGLLARAAIDPLVGLPNYVVRDLLRRSGIDPTLTPNVLPIAQALYRLFITYDALVAEINPLGLTAAGRLVAVDARLVVDDSALARQPEIARLAAEAPEEALEERVKREHDFDLLILDEDGDVGLVSTGAGGTMITVDLIERSGGRPINFADVRTGRLFGDPTRLIVVLQVLAERPSLKSLLVSVFGSLTEMDEFAHLVGRALATVPLGVPRFARVQGRKAAEARAIFETHGFTCFDDLEEAVREAVAAGQGR